MLKKTAVPPRFYSTAPAKSDSIDYNHGSNLHTLEGPRAALPLIFQNAWPASVLDVGCGTGTWLKVVLENGIKDVMGLDGVAVNKEKLLVPVGYVRVQDLTQPWQLDRRFDAVLCLEVAEHLDAQHSDTLIQSVTAHADVVVFSAAIPGQSGQHHVNCQWPAFWQTLFNAKGFACDDAVRWRLWNERFVEPWYRQNLFIARRDPMTAGREPRLPAVIHPEMLPTLMRGDRRRFRAEIESGSLSTRWYLRTPFIASWAKLTQRGKKPVPPSEQSEP